MAENVSRDILDAYKRHHNLPSDYAAAKKLDVPRNLVSMWRSGDRRMTDDQALEICEELGLQWPPIVAALHAERAIGTPHEARWRRYCARVCVAALATATLAATIPDRATATVISQLIDYAQFRLRHFIRRLRSRFSLKLRVLSALRVVNDCALTPTMP